MIARGNPLLRSSMRVSACRRNVERFSVFDFLLGPNETVCGTAPPGLPASYVGQSRMVLGPTSGPWGGPLTSESRSSSQTRRRSLVPITAIGYRPVCEMLVPADIFFGRCGVRNFAFSHANHAPHSALIESSSRSRIYGVAIERNRRGCSSQGAKHAFDDGRRHTGSDLSQRESEKVLYVSPSFEGLGLGGRGALPESALWMDKSTPMIATRKPSLHGGIAARRSIPRR